jgi:hypothetical protein
VIKEKVTVERLSMRNPATYRIIVQGRLDPSWIGRMSGMNITERCSNDGNIETILVGRLPDQAALSGVLTVLYELHLPIVSADCLESD